MPSMSNELLPKVELWRISDEARQALIQLVKQSVREALEEQGLRKPPVPTGALRGADAAAYHRCGTQPLLRAAQGRPSTSGPIVHSWAMPDVAHRRSG